MHCNPITAASKASAGGSVLLRGHKAWVDKPVIADLVTVENIAVLQHDVLHSLILDWIMTVRLNANHIDGDSIEVEGLQDLELGSLHVQAPEVDMADAELGQHGGEGHAGDHGQALLVQPRSAIAP